MVLSISTVSASISMTRAISSVMSPACVLGPYRYQRCGHGQWHTGRQPKGAVLLALSCAFWPNLRSGPTMLLRGLCRPKRKSRLDSSCSSQLFIDLQFNGDDFGGHMRFVHDLVRQHGLPHDAANCKDVRHVGAYLNVSVEKPRLLNRQPQSAPQSLF